MKATQAKRLTWGCDDTAWLAYADWCEERGEMALACLWRTRAASAAALRRCVEALGKRKDVRHTVSSPLYPATDASSVYLAKGPRIVLHPCKKIAIVCVKVGNRCFVTCNFLMGRLNDPKYLRRRIFELAEAVARALASDERRDRLHLELRDDWEGSGARRAGLSFDAYLDAAADDNNHPLQDAARDCRAWRRAAQPS